MKRTSALMALAVTASLAMQSATAKNEAQSPDDYANIFNTRWAIDATGVSATHSSAGRIDTRGAFFQSLGINGRSCATCHALEQAMSISPPQIQDLFDKTRGRDPLFTAVDGANCPQIKTGDRAGHSLMLQHGLVRVGVTLPATTQFTLSVIHDPYGCSLTTDAATGQITASVYRRPLPTANLGFLSAVMFDGRETVAALTNGTTFAANLTQDLTHQANSAIHDHFQAPVPASDQQVADIVNFELALTTGQAWDWDARSLSARGAQGGPLLLAKQEYYPGINDVLGADPTGVAFTSSSMTLFKAWEQADPSDDVSGDADAYSMAKQAGSDGHWGWHDPRRRIAEARADIAAGEKLFNTAPLTITNVRGLNDSAALNRPTSFQGTCTTCHDAPNVGDHSLPLPLDIGVAHAPRSGLESDSAISAAMRELDEPDLPVFLVQGCSNPFNAGQAESFYTTDPGKALVTGQCSDFNRFKGPILRGLAARAPYFHNGSAKTLLQAVNFYNQRFGMNLTERQKDQLVAFLSSL